MVHRSLVDKDGGELFVRLCNALKKENVQLFSGPKLSSVLTFGPPEAKNLKTEYGTLACTIEMVDDLHGAIEHINVWGSGHTDSIVTESGKSIIIVDRANEVRWPPPNKTLECVCVCACRSVPGQNPHPDRYIPEFADNLFYYYHISAFHLSAVVDYKIV